MTRKVKSKTSETNNSRLMIIGGMVVLAIVLIVGFIVFLNPSGDSLDYSNVEKSRTEDGAFVLGNPEAAVTIVAWEDFLCPHCQGYQPELHRFFKDFVLTGRAQFEFRMLPISPNSPLVFGLVECADAQEEGAFWKAHDTMFNIVSSEGFSNRTGRKFADTMGMAYGDLLSCANENNQYLTDQALARTFTDPSGQQIVTGTPSVGWRLDGGEVRFDGINRRPSYDELAALIKTFSN